MAGSDCRCDRAEVEKDRAQPPSRGTLTPPSSSMLSCFFPCLRRPCRSLPPSFPALVLLPILSQIPFANFPAEAFGQAARFPESLMSAEDTKADSFRPNFPLINPSWRTRRRHFSQEVEKSSQFGKFSGGLVAFAAAAGLLPWVDRPSLLRFFETPSQLIDPGRSSTVSGYSIHLKGRPSLLCRGRQWS